MWRISADGLVLTVGLTLKVKLRFQSPPASKTIFRDNIPGYRKGHSTTNTVLLGIRDNILHVVKRWELTLMTLAEFSKAFDAMT